DGGHLIVVGGAVGQAGIRVTRRGQTALVERLLAVHRSAVEVVTGSAGSASPAQADLSVSGRGRQAVRRGGHSPGTQEQAADNGVVTAVVVHLELDMAFDVPDQILAIVET